MAERGSAGWLESDGFTTLDASELARLVDRTSERELRHRLIGGVREVALREIFRRMPEYLRPARAAGFDAVVAWQITGAGGDGRPADMDEHWIRVRGGRCTVLADQPGTADISIRTEGGQRLGVSVERPADCSVPVWAPPRRPWVAWPCGTRGAPAAGAC